MRYGVGIDLGTSFTSAAISGPDSTRMMPMSPSVVVPSVAYRQPGGDLVTGDAALHPDADRQQVARNFKRRLGDPTPLFLGGASYSPAALMAAQLRDVLATATRMTGEPPESVVLTYPAIWGSYRREHFTEVPRLAQVPDFRLLTEPEATATYYSSERRLADGEVVAVYDLGGGTFDTTVLRMSAGRMEILGTPEGIEHLGGIDFDRAVLAHLDERLDGAISELDQDDPRAATALATIETMCVRTKEALSTESDVHLSVPLPTGPRDLTITRGEFNEVIAPSVQLTIDGMHRTTASAGLSTDDLSAVLLAGGSSRVPFVGEQIAREIGKPVRAALHPKYTVALGAAQVSAQPRPADQPAAVPGGASAPAAPWAKTGLRSRFRRKWLVPGIAAVAVLVVAVTVTSFITTSGKPTIEPVYDGHVTDGFAKYIASAADGWQGSGPFGDRAKEAMDVEETPDGLHTTWHGDPAQVYLQTQEPINASPYLDGGALVFDAVLHTPPTGYTGIGMHCGYPCGGEVPAAELFRSLPPEQPKTVKIPLACFTEARKRPDGVPPHSLESKLATTKKVDTPFLVFAQQDMDVTLSNIRLETGAANDADAQKCGELG